MLQYLTGGNWGVINFQRSTSSTRDAVRFTINLGVSSARLTASFVIVGPGLPTAVWSLGYLPVWVVAAKLFGLYDRDHRTLRHLTVDELCSEGVASPAVGIGGHDVGVAHQEQARCVPVSPLDGSTEARPRLDHGGAKMLACPKE